MGKINDTPQSTLCLLLVAGTMFPTLYTLHVSNCDVPCLYERWEGRSTIIMEGGSRGTITEVTMNLKLEDAIENMTTAAIAATRAPHDATTNSRRGGVQPRPHQRCCGSTSQPRTSGPHQRGPPHQQRDQEAHAAPGLVLGRLPVGGYGDDPKRISGGDATLASPPGQERKEAKM